MRVEPLDGDRVLVVSGLKPGVRIVAQGAGSSTRCAERGRAMFTFLVTQQSLRNRLIVLALAAVLCHLRRVRRHAGCRSTSFPTSTARR